jgi:hypothetical protein
VNTTARGLVRCTVGLRLHHVCDCHSRADAGPHLGGRAKIPRPSPRLALIPKSISMSLDPTPACATGSATAAWSTSISWIPPATESAIVYRSARKPSVTRSERRASLVWGLRSQALISRISHFLSFSWPSCVARSGASSQLFRISVAHGGARPN